MKKGFSMLRGICFAIILLFTLSACASTTATPSLSPSPELSSTPPPTRTVSIEDITAFATYRPTLAPSFTPITPSVTPIPSLTYTPTSSPTRTPIPEEELCDTFGYGPYAPQGAIIGLRFEIPDGFSIKIEILNNDTGELMDSTLRHNQDALILAFDPSVMPAMDYLWRATLEDENRAGLCPMEGVFRVPDLNAESTAESTAESVQILPSVTPTARARSTEETAR